MVRAQRRPNPGMATAKQREAQDVDVNLSGGTAAEGWRLSGDNLGSPIPRLRAEYQKAGKYALEGEVKRIRHVAAEDANVKDGRSDLETIRDVYRVGARCCLRITWIRA